MPVTQIPILPINKISIIDRQRASFKLEKVAMDSG